MNRKLERVRALVDGELSPSESAELRQEAESDPELALELAEQEMVRTLLAPRPVSKPLKRWWRHRAIPLGFAASLAALVVIGWGGRRYGSEGMIPVRFVYEGTGQKVGVAGSFNGWQADSAPLEEVAPGTWSGEVLLPRGQSRYSFRVDGAWRPDPSATHGIPDGLGHVDSLIDL